jgi:MFS transporter, DHA3 family, macrolide efflux protein
LLTTNQLEIWHIYLATAISATCGTFQIPAYEAAITMLVPKQHFGRANGMVQMGIALGQLIAPVLGGVLLVFIHLQGIIFIDFITFLFAIIPLLLVRFADPQDLSDQKTGQKKLLQSAIEGWQYIASRSGLLSLLVFTAISNFIVGFAEVLFTPLVLSFASEIELGTVLSIGGMGMLIGSLVVSTWGGSQRYILNVFGFTILGGLSILAAGMKTSVALVAVAAFLFFFGLPISNSSSQVIFQKKVSPHIQGRVFAFTGAVTAAALPLAYVIAAPLAEKIFEPLMSVDGWLAGSIGKIIGVGSGRGIGLLFAVLGILTILFTIVAYQYPRLRFVDDELPDIVQEKDITLGSNV